MTSKDDQEDYKLLIQAQDMASDLVEYIQKMICHNEPGATEQEASVIRAALAIAYTTLSKATGVSMHEVLDLVMTIYKNTVVEKEE